MSRRSAIARAVNERNAIWTLSALFAGLSLAALGLFAVVWPETWDRGFDELSLKSWEQQIVGAVPARRAVILARLERNPMRSQFPCALLIREMTESEPVRMASVRVLAATLSEGRCGDEVAVALSAAPDPAVRSSLAQLLGHASSSISGQSVTALVEALRRDSLIRGDVMAALIRLRDTTARVRRALTDVFPTASEADQAGVVDALTQLGADACDVISLARRAVETRQTFVHTTLLRAIEDLAYRGFARCSAIQFLQSMQQQPSDVAVRAEIARALRRIERRGAGGDVPD